MNSLYDSLQLECLLISLPWASCQAQYKHLHFLCLHAISLCEYSLIWVAIPLLNIRFPTFTVIRNSVIILCPHIFKIFYLFIFREREGREKERERNISVWLPLMWPPLGTWPATQACALTGNWTGDPLVHNPRSIHWATPASAMFSFSWETALLFSIPTALGFQFLHILVNTCYFLFLFCFYSSHPNRYLLF